MSLGGSTSTSHPRSLQSGGMSGVRYSVKYGASIFLFCGFTLVVFSVRLSPVYVYTSVALSLPVFPLRLSMSDLTLSLSEPTLLTSSIFSRV